MRYCVIPSIFGSVRRSASRSVSGVDGLGISEVVLEGNPVVAAKYKKAFDSYIRQVKSAFGRCLSVFEVG